MSIIFTVATAELICVLVQDVRSISMRARRGDDAVVGGEVKWSRRILVGSFGSEHSIILSVKEGVVISVRRMDDFGAF